VSVTARTGQIGSQMRDPRLRVRVERFFRHRRPESSAMAAVTRVLLPGVTERTHRVATIARVALPDPSGPDPIALGALGALASCPGHRRGPTSSAWTSSERHGRACHRRPGLSNLPAGQAWPISLVSAGGQRGPAPGVRVRSDLPYARRDRPVPGSWNCSKSWAVDRDKRAPGAHPRPTGWVRLFRLRAGAPGAAGS